MGLSFTVKNPAASGNKHITARRTVLVTGAAGRIGSYFARFAADRYLLRLMVHHLDEKAGELEDFGEVIECDLANLDMLKSAFQDVDTVVHLAGDPDPNAVWEDLLEANIKGTYNVFVAAKTARCSRVIFASSIHAVSGYPADVQVRTTEPVNPGDLYGVSKCFGEALARYFAEREGVSAIALRIGAFQPLEAAQDPGSVGLMDRFISERDLSRLILNCIEDDKLQFAIFHALSDNRFKRLDITDARELVGYQPEDDFTTENPALEQLDLRNQVSAGNASDRGTKSGIRRDL
jgi:UDP-glucose 4-epimerase